MNASKYVKIEEVNLPFDELILSDDELFVIKGGFTEGMSAGGSGCGCGCGCSSGAGCGCGCSSGAGCGCGCSSNSGTTPSCK